MLDDQRGAQAVGDGQARPARARAGHSLRARQAGRAGPHRRQTARAHPERGGQQVRQIKRQHYNTTVTDRDGRRRNTVGWDFVHVAIDDATRLAYAEVLGDEKATTAIGFLTRAVAFFAQHGITVQRVLADNGSPYRASVHALACRALGVRHLRTRPYRPQTNGKAERFIRTLLGGWAYGAIYGSSKERTAALDGWLWHYNHRRRHQAIGRQTPITRLNNLLETYS